MSYKKGTVLFAGWVGQEEFMKRYIKIYGLTKHDVKIEKRGDELLLRARRDVSLLPAQSFLKKEERERRSGLD